jgi:hypothetical protein
MVDGVVSLVLFLLENGPSLLFWLVVLFFPARLAWKSFGGVSRSNRERRAELIAIETM